MRLIDGLRAAARAQWLRERADRLGDPAARWRFARRRRDCNSLLRLGEPAMDAVDLAARLASQLGLEARPGSPEARDLALGLTALWVELYDEMLADESDQSRGRK